MSHFAVNWLAVVLAAIAAYAFGAVWYMGLSRQWMAALGKTKDQLQVGFTPFIWSFAVELVMAYFIALLTPVMMGEITVASGALVGVHMWVGFVITTLIMNHRYEGMKWSLTVIDGLHLLGVLVIQGVVIGLLG
ncbi:Protein of unknown function [Devosia lucknowensis]|uniref:DUF1761 domain-containing protein n=1 Tax=Devosia lucknowensis TaxID=1096929 RepID=A0A1Y6GE30_9HYPH|nr:DUF1761 domain-containing protein [Devosia lucknowensis]SMQ86070.1 Protein of unknown function [Devosia lucknowensis]